MINNIKLAVKNSAIYSLGPLSTKFAGFILIPLYTDYFSTTEFGVLGIIEVSLQIVISLFGFALYWAFNRWYWDREYRHKQKTMFFTVFIFLSITSLIMVILFFPFCNSLSMLLFDSGKYSLLLKLMLISAAFQIVNQVPATLLKLQQKPLFFSIANIIKLILSLSLTIHFIVNLKHGLNGIYEAQIIGGIFYLLFLSKYIIKNIELRFELLILKEMLIFSLPIVFSSMAGIVFSFADRYILKFIGGLSNVGIYSLGFKISNTIKVFVIESVILAISPMIYKMMDQKGNKRFYSKIMTYLGFSVIVIVLIVSFFSKEIVVLLAQNKAYWNAYKIIPIISFSMLFIALRYSADIGINIMKKTKIKSAIVITVALINIVLNVILIPTLNEIGAALSSLFSQLFFFLLTYYYAQKHYHIPFEIGKITKMIAVAVVFVMISIFVININSFWNVIIRIIMLISFPIILYYLDFYEPVELEKLQLFINKLFKASIKNKG